MNRTDHSLRLSHRYVEALDYAREQHAAQTRKGTNIPYLSHLIGVSALVLDHGGDEEQAIAALLHDVIEDCGARHEAVVRERFGDRVATIVLACTDGTEESKAEAATDEEKREAWRRRKLVYIEHLRDESDDALLVSCCDKLHNARAIVGDIEDPKVGLAVFDRFTAGRDGTLRYYHSVSDVFTRRGVSAARALDAVVARMHELAGAQVRAGLA